MEMEGEPESWNYCSSFDGVFGISSNTTTIKTPDNLPKSDESTVLKGKLPRDIIQVCLVDEKDEIKKITLPIIVTVQLPGN